jgi:hypothetical protein
LLLILKHQNRVFPPKLTDKSTGKILSDFSVRTSVEILAHGERRKACGAAACATAGKPDEENRDVKQPLYP